MAEIKHCLEAARSAALVAHSAASLAAASGQKEAERLLRASEATARMASAVLHAALAAARPVSTSKGQPGAAGAAAAGAPGQGTSRAARRRLRRAAAAAVAAAAAPAETAGAAVAAVGDLLVARRPHAGSRKESEGKDVVMAEVGGLTSAAAAVGGSGAGAGARGRPRADLHARAVRCMARACGVEAIPEELLAMPEMRAQLDEFLAALVAVPPGQLGLAAGGSDPGASSALPHQGQQEY